MPDLPLNRIDRPITQVTVVCLVALTSGKMHCLLDAKHCEEIGEGGAAQALLPPAGGRPGALAHRALSSNPTVRVSCKHTAMHQQMCSSCALLVRTHSAVKSQNDRKSCQAFVGWETTLL